MWYRHPDVVSAMADLELHERADGTYSDTEGVKMVTFLPEGVTIRSVAGPGDVIETTKVTASPDVHFLDRAIQEHVEAIGALILQLQEATRIKLGRGAPN